MANRPSSTGKIQTSNSTDCSCCNLPCALLASARMNRSINSTMQPWGFVGAGLALPGRPAGRLSEYPIPADATLQFCQLTPKLDFRISHTKQTTSQFLIDNFCKDLACSSLACLAAAASSRRRVTGHSPLPSNRPYPRLEIPVSYRKQTIAPSSNRPYFAVCNFPLPSSFETDSAIESCPRTRTLAVPSHSPLVTRHCLLIANDMHSRKESSRCKHSTYRFLIDNEFHLQRSPFKRQFCKDQRTVLTAKRGVADIVCLTGIQQ